MVCHSKFKNVLADTIFRMELIHSARNIRRQLCVNTAAHISKLLNEVHAEQDHTAERQGMPVAKKRNHVPFPVAILRSSTRSCPPQKAHLEAPRTSPRILTRAHQKLVDPR